MKRIMVFSLALCLLLLSTALAETAPIHYLWDIPTMTNIHTYATNLEKQKSLKLIITSDKEEDDHRVVQAHSEYFEMYGLPASLEIYQKTRAGLPYFSCATVGFNEVTDRDYQNVIFYGQELADVIYSGLISKYGKPTSIRVKYNNSLFVVWNDVEYASETREVGTDFYTDEHLLLGKLADWWRPAEDGVSFELEIVFSNIRYMVNFSHYVHDANAASIKCRVEFFDNTVVPMELSPTISPTQTRKPKYEDSGF